MTLFIEADVLLRIVKLWKDFDWMASEGLRLVDQGANPVFDDLAIIQRHAYRYTGDLPREYDYGDDLDAIFSDFCFNE